MLDDQWLAQLTACAEFEQLWDSFRLALTDCDDLVRLAEVSIIADCI